MTDFETPLGEGAFGPEPSRDVRLGNMLREQVGGTPFDAVNWARLANRISSRMAALPWYAHVARWERRAIPIALAAGLAGAVALLSASGAPRVPAALPDGLAIVVTGTPAAAAAKQYARELTNGIDVTDTSAPE